ncbi:hypothetical protein Glove_349g120 [Diversispora epigaea]|uniref:BTB domain-containing protein n=1 Tax=Diversispora epigaea TaxID=1348612 RepID=A0A397HEC8_9GLOM|nr:hypothetical protein Glove_349g120 [Diversispora epigaea]
MSLKFFDKLSQNFIELLDEKDDYNVIIEVKNKEKSFMAHSNILKHRSSYFRKELENIRPNKNNIKTIIKSSISAQIFDVILKYIYGGIVNLENVETRFIYDLMLIANELEFEELTTKLETLLIETKASWLKTHFSFIYHSIFINNNFKNLEKFCNDIIVKYPNLIFENSDFISFPESALISLLKRDDLQIEEIKIWDYIIKWGISQNPTLPKNLVEWNKENFLTLQTTLQQCLPYIRYFHIPGNDILDKIQPFKKILDKPLWKDLMQYLISPDRPVNSIILPARSVLIPELPTRDKEQFSTIITNEHIAEISSWIDRKSSTYFTFWNDPKPSTYSLSDIPYEFQLILRGSINGFAPQTFWDRCHGYYRTVVVMKVKGTDEIFGGYNPLAWDANLNKNTWVETKDSFIFSLKNGNIENSILSRVKKSECALKYLDKSAQKSRGPYFGDDFYMYSLSSNFTLDQLCRYRNYGYYEKPITTAKSFSIVDYEVFKIIKKTI